MKYFFILTLILIQLLIQSSYATTIVTTLPELKWLVDELTVDQSNIKSISLLSGNEDPHFVDATPGFIFKVSKADLVVANGLQLEIGWLPKVIQMASNSNVQFNSIGYCDSSSYVTKKQVLKNFDRSMGDVHPMGNPHYSLSLLQMKNAAKKIKECLMSLSSLDQKLLQKNYLLLVNQFDQNIDQFRTKLKKLKDIKMMTYHREFVYYFSDFQIETVGTLEKVPGILPSGSHLFKVAGLAKKRSVELVLASATNPKKYLKKFKELTDIPFVQLPLHMTTKFKNYWDFQNYISNQILKKLSLDIKIEDMKN